MRIFSNLNLSGDAPVRAQVGRGRWGPTGVPSTRWKKIQRILIPFVVVAIGVNDLRRRDNAALLENYRKIADAVAGRAPLLFSAVLPLDERVKVCVDLCCLTDFHELIATRGLDGHGIYYYVPSLLKHFTAAQINALIAPRPHLGLAGNLDPLTPRAGLDRIDAELRRVYAEHNAANAWTMKRYEIGHFETAEMRAEVLAYLKAWL